MKAFIVEDQIWNADCLTHVYRMHKMQDASATAELIKANQRRSSIT